MFDLLTHKLEVLYNSDEKSLHTAKSVSTGTNINSPEEFYSSFVNLDPQKTKIIETDSPPYIFPDNYSPSEVDLLNIINLKRLNNICRLEDFLEAVNEWLPFKGIFICHAETLEQRYSRIIHKYPKSISYPFYILDFILKRLFPKWGPTKKIYYILTKGNNSVLSLSHILGIFCFYGFKVQYFKDINNLTYFVFQKINHPAFNSNDSSCGIFFKMKRVGQGGKIIDIYKLRTMHPYAEYLQKFVYEINNLKDGGKIKDDFRIASWGKFLRKYWIDELPMLYNWIKGDLKLVGLRPLSEHYLSLYTKELRKKRLIYKPGLIPPFYYDLPKTLDEIMRSEERYMDQYDKSPIKTDLKYLANCLFNILLKGARSS